jgi:hypothetical protein
MYGFKGVMLDVSAQQKNIGLHMHRVTVENILPLLEKYVYDGELQHSEEKQEAVEEAQRMGIKTGNTNKKSSDTNKKYPHRSSEFREFHYDHPAKQKIDFMSCDIDSYDWHIWRQMLVVGK